MPDSAPIEMERNCLILIGAPPARLMKMGTIPSS
jgi:hypothetical protein